MTRPDPTQIEGRLHALAQVWERPFLHTMLILLERGLRDAESRGVCRDCGCTDDDACTDEATGEPCRWAADDLCSRCAEKG